MPCPFSDHSAVSLTWSLPDSISRGPGLWKLNCSVLDDPDYVDLMSSFGLRGSYAVSLFLPLFCGGTMVSPVFKG